MKLDWVEIPEGEFLMGLSEEQSSEFAKQTFHRGQGVLNYLLAQETPQRVIILPTFYITRFPITHAQFVSFVHADHPQFDVPILHDPNWAGHPVTCLWHSAWAFCHWIGARLPSSLEWEKTARGVDGRLYPWGNAWDPNRGNFGQENRRKRVGGTKTSPVGVYPEGASPYGAEDLLGNGYEWTMTLGVGVTCLKPMQKYRQAIVIRGSAPDPEAFHPWNHRVTKTTSGGVLPDEMPPYTGFRPVMDKWQRQQWLGFHSGENEEV